MCMSATRRQFLFLATAAIAMAATRGAMADPPSKSSVKGATEVTAQAVQDMIGTHGDRVRIIDARRPGAFDKSHIPNAMKIDWRYSNVTRGWTFDAKKIGGNKPDPLVIYGADAQDGFAALAAEKAVAEGYTNVLWLRGGFAEWVAANKPVTS